MYSLIHLERFFLSFTDRTGPEGRGARHKKGAKS
jgi:hypothetical protein